jgi:PAS domain S-box-containing protein
MRPKPDMSVPRTITNAAAVFCVVAGCLVLAGWVLDIALFKSISPEWVSMKANSAVYFILAGASLWMLRKEPMSSRRRLLGKSCAVVITALGMLTLAESTLQIDLGIDQLLVKETAIANAFHPGRMPPVTSVCSVLVGLALLGLDWKTRRGRLTEPLPLVPAHAGLFAITCYLYGAKSVYHAVAFFSPMALHTAVLFILLSLGVLSARSDRGLTGVLTGPGVGSIMARRLLPLAVGLPVLVGWLWLTGQHSGSYTTEMGFALFATSLIVVLAVFIWRTAVSLNQGEVARNSARKQGEEERNRSFALSRDLLCTLGFDGYFKDLNPAWEKTLGYSKAELLSTPFIEFVHPDDRPATLAEAEGVSGGKELNAFENRYRCKDGSYRCFLWSATPVIADRLIYGAARDITERKQAEEALLQAGSLESAILNSANFSCIATDAKGVIQIFNVGAERMLGYTTAEVVNTITPAAFHDPQEVIAHATALSLEFATPIAPGFEALVFKAARGIKDVYELTKVRKDGSRFPAVVSVTALRDARDGIIGYLLIGTDNTAQKQVEEERKKFEQRLRDQQFYTRSLIESNIDALITTDPLGTISDVNKQMETLTGCTRDELIGAPFKQYFTDSGRAQAGINRVLHEGKVTNYELTARARDGTLTVVSYNATTFHDRDRTLQGVFAAARDMTELKRFEQTLQLKNIELEDASRMKSAFLANMSHELRTPLNSIIGFSEVLKDGLAGDMTERQRGFIGDIFGSGKHLLSLINDILDLSKVEAGKMMLDLETISVSSLLANSLSIIREKAAVRQIRLSMNAPEALGSIRADPRKVKQIVYNLLSNAVKFTKDGGQVTLRASRVPRADVSQLSGPWTGRAFPLAESEFAEFLKITVTDSGIGISDEGSDRLFKPFSQIDSGLARKFEGTGLGLVMVKLLAELHGGTVAVESAVGNGSCFTVWLPLRAPGGDALTLALAPAATTPIESLGEARIALVVENDFKAADLIRVQLAAEGFKVLHAASAEAALVLAVQQPLSLITLDIMLPNMDGWDFLSRIKQVPELRRIPVVIISIAADRNKGFSLGAAAVMQKPISRQELYEALVDLGLFPLSQGQTLKVLVVDDDPKAVELIALRVAGLASTVLRAYGGREAIEIALRELPDAIVLDLMMPEVTGFDVVAALNGHTDTARIPILVVTAKRITAGDRAKLSGYVATIMEKAELDQDRFIAEVRRAMSGRKEVA